MALTFGSEQTSSNGTTEVDVVSSPAASTVRQIVDGTIYNPNSDEIVEGTLTFDKNGTETDKWHFEVHPLDTWHLPGKMVLDATDEALELVLDAAVSGSELECDFIYMDVT